MSEIDRPEPEEGQILVVGREYKPDNDSWHDYEIQIRRHNTLSDTNNNEGFTKFTKYESGGSGLDFWTAYWAKKYAEKHGYEDVDLETVNLESSKTTPGESTE